MTRLVSVVKDLTTNVNQVTQTVGDLTQAVSAAPNPDNTQGLHMLACLPKSNPVVGGRNGSCQPPGLWQTVSGASYPITVDNNYGNTTTGRGRWFPVWSWTNAERTIRPLLSPKSKCPIGTWNVRTMSQTGKATQVEGEMLLRLFLHQQEMRFSKQLRV